MLENQEAFMRPGWSAVQSGFPVLNKAGPGFRYVHPGYLFPCRVRGDQGFQPPLPYGRVMISRRWPFRSSK
jgi:hypothetical protein